MKEILMSRSPEETEQAGAHLAALLAAHRGGEKWFVCLYGDLGAGKSELTRGIATGLGVRGPVTSPSFTIMNVYEDGRLPLYHFDWYRLESSEELYEMGMDEYLTGDGVCVIEWPGVCPDAIPATRLDVTVTPLDDASREITLTPRGGFHPIAIAADQSPST